MLTSSGRPIRFLLKKLLQVATQFFQTRIEQYLRISVGTPQQCDALMQALAQLLSAPGAASQ